MPDRLAHTPFRRRSMLQLFLSTGLGLAGCGGGSDEPANDATAALLQPVADAAVASGLVGVTLGEVTSETRASVVSGRRRQGKDARVQKTDRFAIGSTTKAMTSAAIAALAERGDLRSDLTLPQAFPEWSAEMHPAYAGVTLKDLVEHRGAVAAFGGGGPEEEAFFAAVTADTAPLPDTLAGRRRYFARWLLAQPPVAGVTPGRDFHYSNAGYALAAAVVEARTGRDFEAVFHDVLVQPLGLQGQWRSPVPAAGDTLWGHEGPAGALVVVEPTDEMLAVKDWVAVIGPAGHWACTGDAYAQWLRWHVLALRGASTPLPRVYVEDLRSASDNRYVWGWQSVTTATRVLLTHAGHVNGFMAEAVTDTRGDRALFGLSNTGHMAEDGTSWVLSQLDATLAEVLRLRGLPL